MQCVVCTGEATDLTPKNFDGHVIVCPSCGKYEVAGGTWERLQNASQQERCAALAKAASLKGVARWPTIKTICL
jgi:NMD protein affecting ribosome stability and mRNA decay